MNQMTQALQMNVKYIQQDMLREAESDRMARAVHKDDRAAFEHKLVAVAVALVTVLAAVVLI
jgi:CHASE3 domain sensor protein